MRGSRKGVRLESNGSQFCGGNCSPIMGRPTVLFLQNIKQKIMDVADPGFSAGAHLVQQSL